MIKVCMSVFEEEQMLPGALESLLGRDTGVGEVHVFDGAWRTFTDQRFASADRTGEIARDYGAVWHPAEQLWQSQPEKRTALFHQCGAERGDYIFVFDADERFEGIFGPLSAPAYTVMMRTVGGNDLPGVRGQWPHGDYCEDYIPSLRLFRWHRTWQCLWPGGYQLKGVVQQVYKADPHAHGGYGSNLPVAQGVSFTHHSSERSAERLAQKMAYYAREHPARREAQDAWRRKRMGG